MEKLELFKKYRRDARMTHDIIISHIDWNRYIGAVDWETVKLRDKRQLARKIFSRFFQLVINDIVNNGTIFKFPFKGLVTIYVAPDAPAKTKFRNQVSQANLFAINFKQYTVWLSRKSNTKWYSRRVIIPKHLYMSIEGKVEKGMKYLNKRMYV